MGNIAEGFDDSKIIDVAGVKIGILDITPKKQVAPALEGRIKVKM